MTCVMPSIAFSSESGWRMEPWRTSTDSEEEEDEEAEGGYGSMKCRLLAGRSRIAVGMPRSRRLSKTWLPTNPLAPVSRTFNSVRNWRQPRRMPCFEQPELLANFAELVQGEINLLVGMSRHQADTNEFVTGRNCRRNNWIE